MTNYGVDAEVQIFDDTTGFVRIDHLASGGADQTNRGKHTDKKELHDELGKGVQYQWSPTRQTTVRNRKIKV